MVEGTHVEQDTEVLKHVFTKICEDMGMLLDRPLGVESLKAERSAHKVAGERTVHIAFRLGVTIDGAALHGALLVPLADSISFACYLMMMADDVVATRRKDKDLERATKDAMVEVANLIGGSVDGALRELYAKRTVTRSGGCQGLRPGVAPAFPRPEGSELLIGRAKLKLHTYPSFEAILMLPVIPLATE